VNQGFLSEIERGRRRPSLSSIKALALALDVAPAVLMRDGTEHDAPQPLETRELPLFGTIPPDLPPLRRAARNVPVCFATFGPNRYVLRLTFDPMEPTLKPGDLVLVEYRSNVNPEHVQGRICAWPGRSDADAQAVWVERRQDRLVRHPPRR